MIYSQILHTVCAVVHTYVATVLQYVSAELLTIPGTSMRWLEISDDLTLKVVCLTRYYGVLLGFTCMCSLPCLLLQLFFMHMVINSTALDDFIKWRHLTLLHWLVGKISMQGI